MTRGTRKAQALAVLAVFGTFALVTGCTAAAPPDVDLNADESTVDADSSTVDETPETGERIEYTGASEARVVLDGTPLLLTGDGTSEGGMCIQTSSGLLEANLHLVEINGAPYNGAGSNPELILSIPVAGASSDEEAGVHLLVAGGWLAGDSVSNVLNVETPEVTLAVDGASVTGTQTMVATTGAISSDPVDAEFELVCR